MPTCDTCSLLKIPDNPDHAKHYRVCTWQPAESLPEPILHLERAAVRRLGASRWVTVKVVTEKPEMLPACSCWQPREKVAA